MTESQRIDLPTIGGIALLLMPLMTMLHEIGGHAGSCLALGGSLRELGAFYVDCNAPTDMARRLVAAAGPAIDAVAAVVGYAVWLRLRADRARLIGWYVWLGCGFSCAGYFLFSGVTGVGDLGAEGDAGIGPLPVPALWQILFALGGGFAYFALVRAGMRTLAGMIGQGLETKAARRKIAHGFYIVLCLAAFCASLPNPVGLFVTLASAIAASFGGKAGLISIGFATRPEGEPLPFAIPRSLPLIVAGLAATIAFTLVLGPTIRFG